jgi:hypothetical protein
MSYAGEKVGLHETVKILKWILEKLACMDVKWMQLAQDCILQREVVNSMMSLRVS